MLMTTEQINVRLSREMIDWIDNHPPVTIAGMPGQTGKRTAVITYLVGRAMRRSPNPSTSDQHDSQGDGPGEP
jgi:hypothetical protein